MEAPKKINQFKLTDAAIPIVIAPKYTESSSGERTGFRKRTMDNAPTIPNERAILPEITFVIIKVRSGSRTSVAVCAVVVIHRWPTICNRKRMNIDIDIRSNIAYSLSE